MNIKDYISSGILELYVAGSLSEQENREVYDVMKKHPEILKEMQSIEAVIIKLTAATSPSASKKSFKTIKDQLDLFSNETKVVDITKPKTNWLTYSGWAAALIIGAGFLWILNQNKQLETKITTSENEKSYLETQIEASKTNLANTKKLLNALRDRNIISVPLGGQANFENTYAKVYWNKKDNTIYLDAQGLPEPPKGKVYQVWSLSFNPLSPTSLGIIDNFKTDDNKIFVITNANKSQGFAITLEPERGSKTPTMEQLYTLGVVETAP